MKKSAPKKQSKKSTVVKSKGLMPVHKIGIGALVSLFSILIIIGFIINSSTRRNCIKAQNIYGGTCVTALINIVNDKNNNFRERNTAIWTLGRLRQKEALTTLKSMFTGVIPQREPYDDCISQYEIKKAILLIDKNADLTPITEKSLKEKLMDCLPKSDMNSKRTCDQLLQTIKNYTDCSNAGFPIQETYPERCRTSDGRTFINSN